MVGIPKVAENLFSNNGGARRPKSYRTDKSGEKRVVRSDDRVAEDYSSDYVEAFEASVEKREASFAEMVSWLYELGLKAEQLVEMAGSIKSEFRKSDKTSGVTLKFECKRRPSSNGQLYVAIRIRRDGADITKGLTGLIGADARKLLSPLIGRSATTKILPLIEGVNALNELLTSLSELKTRFDQFWQQDSAALLTNWATTMRAFGIAASEEVQQRISQFLAVDEELMHQAFLFNHERKPMRYNTIFFRMDVAATDPLGPRNPHFRVIKRIIPETGVRITKPITAYKEYLSKLEDKKALKQELGRDPSPAEVAALRASRKKRSHSPWITVELISHCYLGVQTSKIIRRQKKIAACMGVWERERAYFQQLHQQRGEVCKKRT